MKNKLFTYLKQNKLTNISIINKLFVSIFILSNNIKVKNNKLIYELIIKEDDSDYSLLQKVFSEVFQGCYSSINIEDMVSLFEFVVSPADRVITGAVYTPHDIRKKIINTCLKSKNSVELHQIRIADISCGCGGFLMDAALFLHNKTNRKFVNIFKENLFGIDIQDYSVVRTQILLSLLALTHGEDQDFEFNILESDTLDFKTDKWNDKFTNFDIIVGNPPYVCSRNLNEETKQKILKYEVCKSGHPDLYLPFFQIAIEMLVQNGEMGFITMNSFIRSINGRSARDYFSKGKYEIYMTDFRGAQIFRGRNTYTTLFFLKKNANSDFLYYSINETANIKENPLFTRIPYKILDNKNGWALNDFANTRRLESRGVPIANYCKYRHGIATLNNRIYIFRPVYEDAHFLYLKDGNITFPIEKTICREIVNSNKLNSDVRFEQIVEKVIYPYYISNNIAQIIEESVMLKEFPFAYQYLSTKKDQLLKRDKGKTQKYPVWYAYGRTQSLVMPQYKLFFPKIANKPLNCIIKCDSELMLYNGIAFVCDELKTLQILKRIIESDIFWDYIVKNAKPYSSGYYSLSGVDIKKFCIPNLSMKEQKHLLSLNKKDDINKWLHKFYI